MPHSKQGSHFLLKTVLCCNWATRDTEGVTFDAPNQGNRLPNDSCALKKKYMLHSDRVIDGLGIHLLDKLPRSVFLQCRMSNYPFSPV